MTTIDDLNPPDVLDAYRSGGALPSEREAQRGAQVDKKYLLRVLMEVHRPTLLDGLESEFRFMPDRKYRFDYCYPGAMLAVEVQGGRYAPLAGRHMTPGDFEKMQHAAALGWRVFPVLPDQLRDDPLGVLDRLAAALGRDGR